MGRPIKTKSELYWEAIRTLLQSKPGELIKVYTFNIYSMAYREKSRLLDNEHPQFPDLKTNFYWHMTRSSKQIIGRKSGKPTYPYDLYMMFIPKVEPNDLSTNSEIN